MRDGGSRAGSRTPLGNWQPRHSSRSYTLFTPGTLWAASTGHTRAPQVVPPPGTLETPYGQVMTERRGHGGAQRGRNGPEWRGKFIHYVKALIFSGTQTHPKQVASAPGTLEAPYGPAMTNRRSHGGTPRRRDELRRRRELDRYVAYACGHFLRHANTHDREPPL